MPRGRKKKSANTLPYDAETELDLVQQEENEIIAAEVEQLDGEDETQEIDFDKMHFGGDSDYNADDWN